MLSILRGFITAIALITVSFSMPPQARDLGVPVKAVSWIRLHPGQTAEGKASLLTTMSQNNGGFFVADIDLETGHCQQFYTANPAGSTFSTASFRSLRTGLLYVGSAWDGHLHRFDANHPERGIEDLGQVDPEGTFACGITEMPDGTLWIGSALGARLTKYDPATGQFTRYGRMDEGEDYLYPLSDKHGSLAAYILAIRPHIIAIDPKTGVGREIGPSISNTTDKTQFLKLFVGTDGLVYLDSHEGKFRFDGEDLIPVDALPSQLPGIHSTYAYDYQVPMEMPSGWTAQFTDGTTKGTGDHRRVRLTNSDPGIAPRDLTLDWKGGGSNLHLIQLGPDETLYGTSYLPNQLYSATLDGSEIKDLDTHTYAGGEGYSLVSLDGKVWVASYPQARLSVYDPKRPLHFGDKPTDNPRDLGRLDNVGYRPNAMIATPDGRLWMGSAPDYGLTGGTLAWYDPKTEDKQSHRHLLPDTSPASLLYLPELKQILVGLSIEPGTGAQVKRLDGAFALWDPASDKLVWAGNLGLNDMADVVSLAPTANGLVYALIGRGDQVLSCGAPDIRPRLALIDPANRKLVDWAWLPEDYGPLSWHGYNALRQGPGGAIYGATGYCLFRIKPGTCEVERIWQPDTPPPREDTVWHNHSTPDAIDVVGPIIDNHFYFATGWRLRVLTLPE